MPLQLRAKCCMGAETTGSRAWPPLSASERQRDKITAPLSKMYLALRVYAHSYQCYLHPGKAWDAVYCCNRTDTAIILCRFIVCFRTESYDGQSTVSISHPILGSATRAVLLELRAEDEIRGQSWRATPFFCPVITVLSAMQGRTK